MKKGLIITLLVVALVVVTMVTTQSAYAGGLWGWNSNEAEIARHKHQSRHSRQNPNEHYSGSGHYTNYLTNVNVKEQERWEGNKGERSFEQSPNLKAKLIDAGTILGSLFIIFR